MNQWEGCKRKRQGETHSEGGVSVRPEVDKQHQAWRARVNQHQVGTGSEAEMGRTGEHEVQLA